MAKSSKKIKSSSFLTLLSASAALMLIVYLMTSGKFNFNLNSSASRNKYTAVGTLVSSSSDSRCDASYSFGLIDSSLDKNSCITVVASALMVRDLLGQKVRLEGAYTDGMFYATTAVSVSGGTNTDPRPLPVETSNTKPSKTPNVPPSKY